MKYFKNVSTLEELRKQYKELLKKHHPDNVNGSTEATQEINAEYDQLFKMLKDKHESKTADSKDGNAKTDFNNMKYNFTEDIKLREMLNKIIGFDGITIEIISNWIWISGNTYNYKNELKKSGFKWASQKKMWYWKSEIYQKKSRKTLSMNDIRNYYGSVKIQSTELRAIEA